MTSSRKKAKFSAVETLEKFVVRARRVREHSLTRDREQLRRYARFESKVLLRLTGEAVLEEDLPNEERFESLAARLRPLLLASESIFYTHVLDYIEESLRGSLTTKESAAFKRLREAWDSTDIEGMNVQGYSLQTVAPDGTSTAQISDSQLAAGWLYIDLVHVDPRYAKAQAIEHSLKDRFTAATRILSKIAELTIQTLEFIEVPERRTNLNIDGNVWEVPVVVKAAASEISTKIYFAEVGTSPPDISDVPIEEAAGWQEFTLMNALRLRSEKRAAVYALFTHGEEVVDGAVFSRESIETSERIEVLLDSCAIFVFNVGMSEGQINEIGLLEHRPVSKKPSLIARYARLLMHLHEASSIRFEIPGLPGIELRWDSAEEGIRELGLLELAAVDLEIIEQLSSTDVEPLSAGFDSHDLRRLRMVRLLWEGKLVEGLTREVLCVGTEDQVLTALGIPEPVVRFGGVSVPTPPSVIYSHPQVEAIPLQGPQMEDEQGKRLIVLQAPKGQELVAWSPERVEEIHGKGVDMSAQPINRVENFLVSNT